MVGEAIIRDRAGRLYQFVRELILLRRSVVRSIDDYELTISLADLPAYPNAYCTVRGDAESADVGPMLEIKCARIDSYPTVPDILAEWMDPKQLADPGIDLPELLAQPRASASEDFAIADLAREDARVDDSTPDHVRSAWERYVEDLWWPWAERTREILPAKRIYDDLFRMYQRLEHLSETYEVVLGVGMLTWRPSTSVTIKRHLVTVSLSVEFDPRRQQLSLHPSLQSHGARLEDDVLDPSIRPVSEVRKTLMDLLETFDHSRDAWSMLGRRLQEYGNALHAGATYDAAISVPTAAAALPVITFAPTVSARGVMKGFSGSSIR